MRLVHPYRRDHRVQAPKAQSRPLSSQYGRWPRGTPRLLGTHPLWWPGGYTCEFSLRRRRRGPALSRTDLAVLHRGEHFVYSPWQGSCSKYPNPKQDGEVASNEERGGMAERGDRTTKVYQPPPRFIYLTYM